jgi:hypothetical protein
LAQWRPLKAIRQTWNTTRQGAGSSIRTAFTTCPRYVTEVVTVQQAVA